MSGNVVFLAFRAEALEEDQRALLACKNCQNKTYRVVVDRPGEFPLMECAACNGHIGHLGWATDESEGQA